MLGYSGVVQAYSQARFGQLPDPIWLDDVICTGRESELANCQHLPWGQHNCIHAEDAGVACTGKWWVWSAPVSGGCGLHQEIVGVVCAMSMS